MKTIFAFLLAGLLLLLPAPGFSQIYSWVDQDGIRHFSNVEPPPSAENVTVRPGVPESAAFEATVASTPPTVVLVESEDPAADEDPPVESEPVYDVPAPPLYADSRIGTAYEDARYGYGVYFYTGYPFGHSYSYRRNRYDKYRHRSPHRYHKDRYRYYHRDRQDHYDRRYGKGDHRRHPRYDRDRRLYRLDRRRFPSHGYRDGYPRHRYDRGYGFRGHYSRDRSSYGLRIRIGR